MASFASEPPPGQPLATASQRSRNLVLAVLSLTGLMLVLDITITNVALPTIQRALGTTTQQLQWVVNAYALAAGGFLLLGGRLADRLGRRRVFLAGMGLFAVGSLLGGLAPSVGWLITARGLQGLGAALVGPAAFSIITTTFAEGPERNRAVGLWSATAASGGALGMLLGGLLTQYAGWRWVLFVNVPVALLVLVVTPRLVPDIAGEPESRTDVAGAVMVTGGLLALTYATSLVPAHGWTATRTLGLLLVAAVLLAGFVAVEARHRAPLVPLGIFRRRSLTGAVTVGLLVGAGLIATPIFFLTLYLQQILGFSAVQAGLASLPLALAMIAAARLATGLIGTVGARWLAAGGLTLSARRPAAARPHPPRRQLCRRRAGTAAAAGAGDGPGVHAGDGQRRRRCPTGRPGPGLGGPADHPAARRRAGHGRPHHPRHRDHPGPAWRHRRATRPGRRPGGAHRRLRRRPARGRAGGPGRGGPVRRAAAPIPAGPQPEPRHHHVALREASMSVFTQAEVAYLHDQRRLAHLATVGPDGTPHVTPVGMWSLGPEGGRRGHRP